MDNEFNKVTDHAPNVILNTPAASEHVGDIERRIRVIKERCRGILCTLPCTHFPQIMLVHLLHHVVMWLNNIPVKNGVSDRYSPCEIILRHKLNFKNHCRAPFGSYCEVHEDNSPTNSTKSRVLPTICLGPTGNIQGTYSFLNLSTLDGSCIPNTGANDDELDGFPEYSNKIDWSQLADDAAQNADLDITEHLPPPPAVIEIDDDTDYVNVPPATPFIKQEPIISTPTDPPAQSSSPTSTSNFIPSRTRTPRVSQIPPPSTSSRVSTRNKRLPSHLDDYHVFTTVAEERHQPPEHPYHTAGGTDFDLAILDEKRMAYFCHFVMVHTATSLALAQHGQPMKKQYGLKTGLKRFGSRGDTAVTKELSQLHTMNCFRPGVPSSLTCDDRRNALSSLMFLTEKCSGKVKACACANGSVQRKHVAKEEAAAPTVTSEAIFVQSTIYAHESRDVATCNIPGAFLQANNPDFVLMRLDGILAELMVKIAPTMYRTYVTTNAKGKSVLYVQLEKGVYGMMKSALLFYRKLVADLTSIGFEINPYDPCVANKIIDGNQMTICWHVDDLFIGHDDPNVVTTFLKWLAQRYDTDDKKLNVVRGHKHDDLGMNLNFSEKGAVRIDMIPYIKKINDAFPEKITGVQSTPAGDRLFQVRPPDEAKYLPEEQAHVFHHTTAQLLFLSRVRRDIQTTVAFLTTLVKKPDNDDWGKLKRVLKYLHTTRSLHLTLSANSLSNIV
jgi:hypothetical protein